MLEKYLVPSFAHKTTVYLGALALLTEQLSFVFANYFYS